MAPRTTESRAGPSRLRWAPEPVRMCVPAALEALLHNEVQVEVARMPTRLCHTNQGEEYPLPKEVDQQTEERVPLQRRTTLKV